MPSLPYPPMIYTPNFSCVSGVHLGGHQREKIERKSQPETIPSVKTAWKYFFILWIKEIIKVIRRFYAWANGVGKKLLTILCNIVMGPGQKFLTRVGSGQQFMVLVRIWKISPKNVKFFNFFPFKSKIIALGRVRKYPGQSRVGLLFTAGQK